MNQLKPEKAKEILDRSLKVREELMAAVGKLDGYIELLRDSVKPEGKRDGVAADR